MTDLELKFEEALKELAIKAREMIERMKLDELMRQYAEAVEQAERHEIESGKR